MVALLLILAAFLIAALLVVRERRRSTKKVNFLFEAISSGDYNFKFREETSSYRDYGINAALNRIAEIMQAARTRALEQEKYYELIINQVNTGILVVDEKGIIYQSNQEARRLIGLETLTHTQQLKRIDEQLERVVSNIRPGEKARANILNERGEVSLQFRTSAAVLRGKAVRIIAFSDINTEMDDNQMESWNKLIRVLTHEIMNTVTPITSLSETLLRKTEAGELHDGIEAIHTTSHDLLTFVENYRRLTYLPTPSPRPFYVKPFAERMRQIALSDARSLPEGTQITIETEPEDLLVYADESLITHVVTNLLRNALQAIATSGEGQNVWIRAYCDETEAVIIDITNDGPLIPQDVAEHIFVPFFTTKQDGSGIGLSIARQIMKLSGGTLTLKSDAKRRLTTFELMFP